TKIAPALTKAWAELSNPKHNKTVKVKTKKGDTYTFDYTDLNGIFDEAKSVFKKNGISILQNAHTEIENNQLIISVETMLLHSSGEWFKSNKLKMLANQSIQDMGGQITYMKRYSLSAMLGIATEEDDDANGASGNTVEYKGSSAKATDKQLEYVTSLINQKTNDKDEKNKIIIEMITKLKINKLMSEWTGQQASQAIQYLQGDTQ